jgi:glycosyltransferase involved in cell wall biosynthesis
MRVWLVTLGEPLPITADAPIEASPEASPTRSARLLRAGMLADRLARDGHDVVWWTSTFDHSKRAHVFASDTARTLGPRYRIVALHGIAYARSVSLRRVINHAQTGFKLAAAMEREPAPDVILASLPTVEMCVAATEYGARHGVPVVVDTRDMWPDIFAELAPSWARPVARLALAPLFAQVHKACAGATAITGITEPFVDWGVKHAKRARRPLDRAFPLGYTRTLPTRDALDKAKEGWRARGVTEAHFTACFFGAIGRQFDLATIIDVARRLEGDDATHGHFKFVICGAGDDLERYKEMSKGVAAMVFPGWIERAEIASLMEIAKVGLAPYVGGMGYEDSYPNKTIEYLSAGLPIASTLEGLLRQLTETEGCGVHYPRGDSAALEHELRALERDPARLEAMRANARRVFEARFVAENVYGDMIEHLKAVVAHGAR